jgi:hypothetical protein
MFEESELSIDEKRFEEIIRLGYESAKKNLDQFESQYSCGFPNMDPEVREKLSPEEYDEWRISYIAIKALKDKVN